MKAVTVFLLRAVAGYLLVRLMRRPAVMPPWVRAGTWTSEDGVTVAWTIPDDVTWNEWQGYVS
jgi:hypothetical protein